MTAPDAPVDIGRLRKMAEHAPTGTVFFDRATLLALLDRIDALEAETADRALWMRNRQEISDQCEEMRADLLALREANAALVEVARQRTVWALDEMAAPAGVRISQAERIAALEAERDSWKKAHEIVHESQAQAFAEVERLRPLVNREAAGFAHEAADLRQRVKELAAVAAERLALHTFVTAELERWGGSSPDDQLDAMRMLAPVESWLHARIGVPSPNEAGALERHAAEAVAAERMELLQFLDDDADDVAAVREWLSIRMADTEGEPGEGRPT